MQINAFYEEVLSGFSTTTRSHLFCHCSGTGMPRTTSTPDRSAAPGRTRSTRAATARPAAAQPDGHWALAGWKWSCCEAVFCGRWRFIGFLLLLAFHWFDRIEVVVVERLFSAVASVSLVWQDGSGRAERLFSAGAGVSLGFCHGHTDREQASLKAGGAAYQKVFFCAKSSVPCVQGSRAILSTGRCKFRHLLASKQRQGHPLFSRLQR